MSGLTSQVGSSGGLSGANVPAKTDSTPKPVESRSLSIESAIEEVRTYEPPANIVQTGKIDPEVFVKLKAELVKQLEAKYADVTRIASRAPEGYFNRIGLLHYDRVTNLLTWDYCNYADYDLSGEVNVADITPIAQHYLALTYDEIGDDELDRWVDGNNDRVVTVADITPIADNYLANISCYRVITSDTEDGEYEVIGDPIPFTKGCLYPEKLTGNMPDGIKKYVKIAPADSDGNLGERSKHVWLESIEPYISDIGPLVILAGDTVQFLATVTGPGPFTYNWDFGENATPSTCDSESPTVTISETTGTFTGMLTVTSTCGERGYGFDYYVGSKPIVEYWGPNEVQPGSQIQFDAEIDIYPFCYVEWDFGGGATPNISNEFNPTVIIGEAGTYGCHVKASNKYGETSRKFTLYVGIPRIWSITPGDAPSGWETTFRSHEYGVDLNYLWDFGGGALPNTSTDVKPTVIPQLPGTYTITLTIENEYGSDSYKSTFEVMEGGWHDEVVEEEVDANELELKLDSNDHPHICYRRFYPDSIHYCYYDGSTWNHELVSNNLSINSMSFALDVQNNPKIAFNDENILKYAEKTGSTWNFQDVQLDGYCIMYLSLDLDSQDQPYVACELRKNNYNTVPSDPYTELMLVDRDNSDWNIEMVAGFPKSGLDPSLKLDSTDKPHICYIDRSTSSLNIASLDGLSWDFVAAPDSALSINLASWGGVYYALQIDSKDQLCLACSSEPSDRIFYVVYNGVDWQTAPIYSYDAHPRLALDSQDMPHLCTIGAGSVADMHYVFIGNITDMNPWVHTTLVTDHRAWTMASSIDIDSKDKPHIAYIKKGDDRSSELHYIWQE